MGPCLARVCIGSLFVFRAAAQSDGDLDTSFDIGTGAARSIAGSVLAAKVDQQGRIILGGVFTNFNGSSSACIVRLLESGAIDSTFQAGTGFEDRSGRIPVVNAILMIDQGNILIGGSFTHFNGTPATNLVMLAQDGSIATNFQAQPGPSDTVYALAVQPAKGILVGGSSLATNSGNLERLITTGSVDPSFQPPAMDGNIMAIAVRDDGEILIGGSMTAVGGMAQNNGVARLMPDGPLDSSFHPSLTSSSSPPAVVYTIVPQGQQALVGGAFYGYLGPLAPILRRLNSDGSEATRFDETAFVWYTEIQSIVLLPNLKVIAGGALYIDGLSGKPITNNLVIRFSADGKVDPSFLPASLVQVDLPAAFALAIQSDGRLVVGGDFYIVTSEAFSGACRLMNSAQPLLLNPAVQGGYFQFDVITLPGAAYALEVLNAFGSSWQTATSFVGTGTMETHQVVQAPTNSFYRIKQL